MTGTLRDFVVDWKGGTREWNKIWIYLYYYLCVCVWGLFLFLSSPNCFSPCQLLNRWELSGSKPLWLWRSYRGQNRRRYEYLTRKKRQTMIMVKFLYFSGTLFNVSSHTGLCSFVWTQWTDPSPFLTSSSSLFILSIFFFHMQTKPRLLSCHQWFIFQSAHNSDIIPDPGLLYLHQCHFERPHPVAHTLQQHSILLHNCIVSNSTVTLLSMFSN